METYMLIFRSANEIDDVARRVYNVHSIASVQLDALGANINSIAQQLRARKEVT